MSSSPTYTAKFGPWLEMVSSKGKIYYYNRITSTSQWTKPPEWVESAAAKEKEKTITPPPAPPILSQPPPAPSISVNSNETPPTTATTTAAEVPVQNGFTATPVGSTSRDAASADRQGSEKRPISALSRSRTRSRSRSQRRPMSISRSTSRSSRSPAPKRQRTYTSSERSVGSYRSYRRRSSVTSSRTPSRGSNSIFRRDLSSEKGSVPMDVSPGSSPENAVVEEAPAVVEEAQNGVEDNKDASNVTEVSKEASLPPAPLVNGHSKPKIVSTTNFDDLSDGEYEKPEADADFFTDEQLDGILAEHGTSFVPQFLPAVVEMNKEMTALALKHAEIAQELLEVVKDRISITQMITATEIVCEGVEARAKFCKEQADLLSDGI